MQSIYLLKAKYLYLQQMRFILLLIPLFTSISAFSQIDGRYYSPNENGWGGIFLSFSDSNKFNTSFHSGCGSSYMKGSGTYRLKRNKLNLFFEVDACKEDIVITPMTEYPDSIWFTVKLNAQQRPLTTNVFIYDENNEILQTKLTDYQGNATFYKSEFPAKSTIYLKTQYGGVKEILIDLKEVTKSAINVTIGCDPNAYPIFSEPQKVVCRLKSKRKSSFSLKLKSRMLLMNSSWLRFEKWEDYIERRNESVK